MTDTRTLAAMLLHLAGLMRCYEIDVLTAGNGHAPFTLADVEQMAADVQRAPVIEAKS